MHADKAKKISLLWVERTLQNVGHEHRHKFIGDEE